QRRRARRRGARVCRGATTNTGPGEDAKDDEGRERAPSAAEPHPLRGALLLTSHSRDLAGRYAISLGVNRGVPKVRTLPRGRAFAWPPLREALRSGGPSLGGKGAP